MSAESNSVSAKTITCRSNGKDKNELEHSTRPTEEQTRTRAYEIYIQRGRVDGHDLADWLEAETELAEGSRE